MTQFGKPTKRPKTKGCFWLFLHIFVQKSHNLKKYIFGANFPYGKKRFGDKFPLFFLRNRPKVDDLSINVTILMVPKNLKIAKIKVF